MTTGDQKIYLFVCMADCHLSSLCSEHHFLLCVHKAQWCLNPTGSTPVHWSSHPSTCCFQGDSSHAVMDLDVRWMSGGVAHSKTRPRTMEQLSDQHLTVLAMFLTFRKPPNSCTEAWSHTSRPWPDIQLCHCTWRVLPVFPYISTTSDVRQSEMVKPGASLLAAPLTWKSSRKVLRSQKGSLFANSIAIWKATKADRNIILTCVAKGSEVWNVYLCGGLHSGLLHCTCLVRKAGHKSQETGLIATALHSNSRLEFMLVLLCLI